MKKTAGSLVTGFVAICLGLFNDRGEAGDAPVSIGLHKQLLVDDHVFAEKKNLRRVLGKVTKANGGRPIVVADKPWESGRWEVSTAKKSPKSVGLKRFPFVRWRRR